MRVGINATSINDRPSGAKQRFVGLYGALFRSRPENEYIIYEPRDCRVASWFADTPNVSAIATRLPSTGRWGRFVGGIGLWRGLLAQGRLDCFETLHLPLITAPNCPTILTIHDARPVRSNVPWLRRAIYLHVLRRALRHADAVITVSDAMRVELLAIEGRACVTTIYNGIDPTPYRPGPKHQAREWARPFLLAVGHFEARKNYETLLHAFSQVVQRVQPLDLVIVGKNGGTLASTHELQAALSLSNRVELCHDVDDKTLTARYRDASLLVFPSTYEGFGIPVLEAMAAQLPMAVSDLPVFRELTESRAVYFAPDDATEMANVIVETLSSPAQCNEQRAYGARRLAYFDFRTLAEQLDNLHRAVVSPGSQPSKKAFNVDASASLGE